MPRLGLGLMFAQLVVALWLTLLESVRKHRRLPARFPHTPATPIGADTDKVTVYTLGEELYADMLAAIDAATKVIYFETFIWKADEIGEQFKSALGRAADRGVTVHAVWDDFANLVVKRSFFTMPPGVNVMRHPVLSIPWSPRHWGRDHRKLLIVDHQVGFIGGFNIGAPYAAHWRDTHARIEGPSVAELENAFVDFWNLHRVPGRHEPLPDSTKRRWFTDLRIHRNTPRIQVYPIRNMYLEAIDRASERVWLTHAYLIPDADLVAALRAAVLRGVDVRIVVPAKSNHVVADWLSRGSYTELLSSGARLFLYQNAMVHAKTAAIDGTWATIGTANLDRLSLAGNYEVNLEIVNQDVAEHLERVFELDQANSVEMTLDAWRTRPTLAKATELLLSPLRPVF